MTATRFGKIVKQSQLKKKSQFRIYVGLVLVHDHRLDVQEDLDIQEHLAMLMVAHNVSEDELKREKTITSGGQILLLFMQIRLQCCWILQVLPPW